MIHHCRVLVALGVILVSLSASAQDRPELPRIIVFGLSAPADQMQAFEHGLQDLGHINGSTVSIEYYSVQGREGELAELAQQAVATKPKVIAAIGAKAGLAVQRATKDIPIVVVTGDISTTGLVKNLARPEGNVTGLSFFHVDLRLKQFEILLELAPQLRRVNFLVWRRPTPVVQKVFELLVPIAEEKGIEIKVITIDQVEDVKTELAKLRSTAEEGLFVVASPVFDARPAEIGQLTAEYRLIAMLPWKQYVHGGGLVSYSPDIVAIWRRASSYVDRILRGSEPGDVPVEQPTEFELVINLKTAEALGLALPPSILLRATEVIE